MPQKITPPPLPQELGKTRIFENPSVLFVLMGVLTMSAMIGTYLIAQRYEEPLIVIGSVAGVAGLMILIGGLIIHTIEKITLANRLKSEFVSIASHQLRTPLSGIKWYLELLVEKSQGKLSDDETEYLKIIEEANERMIRLVNNLLNVSRIEQGRMDLNKEKIDIIKITEPLLKEYAEKAKVDQIEIIFTKSTEDLPPIFADPERLQIVIENLLSNAINYTVREGKINLLIEKKGKDILFSVKDNGVGIPKKDQDKIFTKFFRSDNVLKFQIGGTGLGLYIARAIVESHGGKIWFKSKEGEGTTFFFTLPIK